MKKILLLLCLLTVCSTITAQDYYKTDTTKTKPNLYIIRLKDGTQLLGRVIEQNAVQSKIQTDNLGLITVDVAQIVSIELYDKNNPINNKPYYPNRFINRLLVAPTGFAMEKDAIEYHNTLFHYSEFAAAMGDRFSIGLGFLTIVPTQFYSLKAKLNIISKEKFNFSVSGNHIGGRSIGSTSIVIPSFSFGKKESFLNISPIFFTEDTRGGFGLSVGYMKKTSPNLTFFTENFFAIGNGLSVENGFVLSGGLRFDRLRHAFDLNVLVPIGIFEFSDKIYLTPSVGYHLKLSK
ncbi:hypothetical protein VB264_12875 [Arcicella aquatica]|uniref:Outer membrane protein beta-barrel domain-containing protein n=1 Tax=Arcicella aquatica TaxID=217141 RepID=A0ABU5QNN0_9BACT|nr:hypothetical protein [Arcicella aquatica]MEA5258682.1 hypothetical protein [Arcicella aquatica]